MRTRRIMSGLGVSAAAGVLAIAAGCVTKGKYNTLKTQLKDTELTLGGELAARDTKITTLETALDEERGKVAARDADIAAKTERVTVLETRVADKTAEAERLGAEKTRLEGELTAVVKDRARLKTTAEDMRRAVAELSERKAQAEARVAQYRTLLARFKAMIDAGKLRVKIADGRMVLQLPTDVLFGSGSAKLETAGKTAIVEVASVLKTIPDRRFQIEGHTDNIPIKTSRYRSNWDLAAARAIVVVKTMTDAGMTGSLLSGASFGEFRPVASNDSAAGRGENRRIEIVLVPDLANLPGFDELQKAVGN